MAYKSDKLNLQSQSIAGRREWVYSDTGSTHAVVAGDNFFSDGKSKGMKVGDVVLNPSPTSRTTKRYTVQDVQGDTGTAYAASVGDTG